MLQRKDLTFMRGKKLLNKELEVVIGLDTQWTHLQYLLIS